jgi:hypothetical protein
MTAAELVTDFSKTVSATERDGSPLEPFLRRILARGTYRGRGVWVEQYFSVAFLEDLAIDVDGVLKRQIAEWAEEHWETLPIPEPPK